MKLDLEDQFGDVYQIKPDHKKFPGFIIVVTDVKPWGIRGYLMYFCDFQATRFDDMAFVNAEWDEIEYVGKLPYVFYQEMKEDYDKKDS